MPRLRTFMSPVRYRVPVEGATDPVKSLPALKKGRNPIYWLDELLNGGLEIPEGTWNQADGKPAFVLLIAGPPGTGKTTFATELCYNLARYAQPVDGERWRSLYITAETSAAQLIENAASFGFDPERFLVYDEKPLKRNRCTVYGAEQFDISSSDTIDYEKYFESFVSTWLRRSGDGEYGIIPFADDDADGMDGRVSHEALPPDVVVLDSLNVLQPDPQTSGGAIGTAFRRLLRWVGRGRKSPRLLVVVLDGYEDSTAHSSWEYLVDAAIRLDASEGPVGWDGYFLRSFQILKVKTQSHAWGKHTLKIYAGPRKSDDESEPNKADGFARIDPPYLETGGTFIFPSVHWQLGKADRFRTVYGQDQFYSSGLESLDSILGEAEASGLPAQKTTAFVGRRGAMKSHLAYYFMLSHAMGLIEHDPHPKHVLLISLRDDLEAAKNTLSKILEQQCSIPPREGMKVIQSLIDADRLEIIYNAPGCITPGELINRVLVALCRERRPGVCRLNDERDIEEPARNRAEIVVLNGLDHLDAKFPLCAAEKVFIPALTSLFRSHEVCSILISADAGAQEVNIGAVSDLVLNFSDVGAVDRSPRTRNEVLRTCGDLVQRIEVEATRVPAGQVGGRWGILGRDFAGEMSFYPASVQLAEIEEFSI